MHFVLRLSCYSRAAAVSRRHARAFHALRVVPVLGLVRSIDVDAGWELGRGPEIP